MRHTCIDCTASQGKERLRKADAVRETDAIGRQAATSRRQRDAGLIGRIPGHVFCPAISGDAIFCGRVSFSCRAGLMRGQNGHVVPSAARAAFAVRGTGKRRMRYQKISLTKVSNRERGQAYET